MFENEILNISSLIILALIALIPWIKASQYKKRAEAVEEHSAARRAQERAKWEAYQTERDLFFTKHGIPCPARIDLFAPLK